MSSSFAAIRNAAAWLDISARGRIYATGEDRIRLLHALASMPLESLQPGEGTEAFFLNAKGRIQVVSRIYIAEDFVLLECDPERRAALVAYLDEYIIMDDVTLEDETESTAAFAVEGPEAPSVLAALGGADLPAAAHAHIEANGRRFFRSSITGGDGFWLSVPASERDSVVSELGESGAQAASERDFELARIVNQRPRWGVDYGDKNIPHETQQLHLVSFTKGCYVGQEIVERVRSQGQVQRVLVPIESDLDAPPADAELTLDGKPAGTLTSPAVSPADGKLHGFAMLRRAAAEPGTELALDGGRAWVAPWK